MSSITNEGYADWYPDSSFSQTFTRSEFPGSSRTAQVKSPLASLCIRLANKIEERQHDPWRVLQRTFFHVGVDKKAGVRSPQELGRALEYFKVLISEGELQLLFDSFQSKSAPGTFDFKAFASALYPPDNEKFSVKDGRKVPYQPTQQEQKEESPSQENQIEVIPLADPASAPFTVSAYIGSSDPHRQTGRRRIDAPGVGNSSSRIFGAGAVTARDRPISINDLHTMRARPFAKAAANALASTKNTKHYASPRSMQTAKSVVRAAKGQTPVGQSTPRVDFLNLSKYQHRYERSQAAQDQNTKYVHTAR